MRICGQVVLQHTVYAQSEQVNPNMLLFSAELTLKLNDIFFNMKYIPFSGRNPVFQETLDVKPHVLILNKMDLADLSNKQVRVLGAVSAMLLSYLEVTDTK